MVKHVAIIGGNFLGCATAYYIRKKLPDVEITIFEKSDRLGGKDFRTISIEDEGNKLEGKRDVLVGRMAHVDVSRCKFFKELMRDADIFLRLDGENVYKTWGLFDWDKDEYTVWNGLYGWNYPLKVLAGFLAFVYGLLWILHIPLRGLQTSFWVALCIVILSFGTLIRKYAPRIVTDFQAHMAFNGAPWSVVSLVKLFENHMEKVRGNQTSTKGELSLTSFLKRRGLLGYTMRPLREEFTNYDIDSKFYWSIIRPLLQIGSNTSAGSLRECNALTGLLCTSQCSMIPRRKGVEHLYPIDAKIVCDALAKRAKASVRLNTNVVSVDSKDDGNCYNVKIKTAQGATSMQANFSSVVLCCTPPLTEFSLSGSETLDTVLLKAQQKRVHAKDITSHFSQGRAQYVNVIKGSLRADYFGEDAEHLVPDYVILNNSIAFHSVLRISKNIFCVYSRRNLSESPKDFEYLFEEFEKDKAKSEAIEPSSYSIRPMSQDSEIGDDLPIKVEKGFLYPAAVKRVGGGVELDCMMGQNIANILHEIAAE